MNKPLVTIITPAYNASRHIADAIDSVLAQTYDAWEMIIIDDGSTDDTVSIVKNKCSCEPRIKLYELKNNSGRASVPRNFGIKSARGEYLAFLDSDDLWLPEKLEKQVGFLERRKDTFLLYGACYARGGGGRTHGLIARRDILKRGRIFKELYLSDNFIPCLSVIMRNTKPEKYLFDEDRRLKAIEDFDLWLSISRRENIDYLNEPVGIYRAHGTNTSSSGGITQFIKRYFFLVKKWKDEVHPFVYFRKNLLLFKFFLKLGLYSFASRLTGGYLNRGDENALKYSRTMLINSFICFSGQLILLLVAFLFFPYTISHLGAEGFGLLSLVWLVFGYFSIFDFGLSRATTRFISVALGEKDHESIPSIFWTSASIQALIGIAGSLALALAFTLFSGRFLKLSPHLMSDTGNIFFILSLSLPAVISSRMFRGALEADQRFVLINLIQIPAGILVYSMPVLGIISGLDLTRIVILISLVWWSSCLCYFLACLKVYPALARFRLDKGLVRPLLSFGSWVTVCNIFVPVLMYIDRFFIVSFISMAALTYYAVPFELLSRLSFIPTSLSIVLYPLFGRLLTGDRQALNEIYLKSLKLLMLIFAPLTLLIVFFSKGILAFWLDKTFVLNSVLVMQVLAIAFFVNGLAQIPASLLDAIGRPDLRGKVFLSYVVFYILLVWAMTAKFGITGAAFAWLIRAMIELIIFLWMAKRYAQCGRQYNYAGAS